MRPDQLLITLTPKMAEALLAQVHPSLRGKDALLRRRLQRIAKLQRWDIHIGSLFVNDFDEARDFVVWFQHAAFGHVGAPMTKSAFFSRIEKLNRFLERSAIDVLSKIGVAR